MSEHRHTPPTLPMHVWRSLHSHFAERIAQADDLGQHLRSLIGWTFQRFLDAHSQGMLVTHLQRRNELDWYVIDYLAEHHYTVTACSPQALGIGADSLVEVEGKRLAEQLRKMLGGDS